MKNFFLLILGPALLNAQVSSVDSLQTLCIKKIAQDSSVARHFLNVNFNNSQIIADKNWELLRNLVTQQNVLLSNVYRKAYVTKNLRSGYLSTNKDKSRIAVCTYDNEGENFEHNTYIYNTEGEVVEIKGGHQYEDIAFDTLTTESCLVLTDKRYKNILVSFKYAAQLQDFCENRMPLKQLLLVVCLDNAFRNNRYFPLNSYEQEIYNGFLPEIRKVTDTFVIEAEPLRFSLKFIDYKLSDRFDKLLGAYLSFIISLNKIISFDAHK